MHTHPLLTRRLLWFQSGGMGQCFESVTLSVWLWVVGWSGGSCFFSYYIWEDKLDNSLTFKMKKFLQNKKGRYSFRQSKRGSRCPSKDFCKSFISFLHCVIPAGLWLLGLWITSLASSCAVGFIYLAKCNMSIFVIFLFVLCFKVFVEDNAVSYLTCVKVISAVSGVLPYFIA